MCADRDGGAAGIGAPSSTGRSGESGRSADHEYGLGHLWDDHRAWIVDGHRCGRSGHPCPGLADTRPADGYDRPGNRRAAHADGHTGSALSHAGPTNSYTCSAHGYADSGAPDGYADSDTPDGYADSGAANSNTDCTTDSDRDTTLDPG